MMYVLVDVIIIPTLHYMYFVYTKQVHTDKPT